jgi:DNA-binding protein Fis
MVNEIFAAFGSAPYKLGFGFNALVKDPSGNLSTIFVNNTNQNALNGLNVLDLKFTHIKLEEMAAKRKALLAEGKSYEDVMSIIQDMKKPLVDNIINSATTDNGKVAVQFLLLACATVNVGKSGSIFSFIFDFSNVIVLRAFFAILNGENPEKAYTLIVDDKPEEVTSKDFSIISNDPIKVLGNIGALPVNEREALVKKYNIDGVVNNANGLECVIAIDTVGDNKMYEELKASGVKNVEFFKRRKNNNWYHTQINF